MPVTREDVISAYRFILGREPENEEVITQHQSVVDVATLRLQMLRSHEFLASAPELGPALPAASKLVEINLRPQTVEVGASDEQMATLLAHVAQTWASLGASEPYWSVLSHDRFRRNHIDTERKSSILRFFRGEKSTIDEFYKTSSYEISMISSLIVRCAPEFDALSAVCVEYGCGVGRLTWQLAPRFRHVLACDISENHLKAMVTWTERLRLHNVSPVQITVEHLAPETKPDLWYSRIVLQHNPPPLIAKILRTAFQSLNPGGLAIFQVPTYCKNYEFKISNYLREIQAHSLLPFGRSAQMEMHVLPQSIIFDIAEKENMSVLEVREDNSTGDRNKFLSNLFVMRRNP